jgi:hypothetical protein
MDNPAADLMGLEMPCCGGLGQLDRKQRPESPRPSHLIWFSAAGNPPVDRGGRPQWLHLICTNAIRKPLSRCRATRKILPFPRPAVWGMGRPRWRRKPLVPINSSSLSIGTLTRVRAPARSARARTSGLPSRYGGITHKASRIGKCAPFVACRNRVPERKHVC